MTIYEAAGGSMGWHNSGTVGELHMRPLGDGMINFQLHDLLVCVNVHCFLHIGLLLLFPAAGMFLFSKLHAKKNLVVLHLCYC